MSDYGNEILKYITNRCKIHVFFSVLLLFTMSANADLSFHVLPATGGIGYSSVGGFAQDGKGYIWCASGDDILRFDGYELRSYNDKITHQGDWRFAYHAIICTRADSLYVCSSRGVYVYLSDADDFLKVCDGSYRYVYEDCRGRLWLTNNAPVCFDPADGTLSPLTIAGKTVAGQFYTSPDIDCAYLIDNDSIYTVTFLSDTSYVVSSKHYDIGGARIAELTATDSALYILSARKGLFRMTDNGTEHLTDVGDSNTLARHLCRDSQGNMWIGAMQGLYKYETSTANVTHYRQTTQRGSLINNSVQAVFFDRDDNLWVGTYAGGLCYASPLYQNNFLTVRQNEYGYINLPVSCILADGEKVWYGTEGNGLFCWEKGKGITAHYSTDTRPGLESANVKALYKYGDDIWIATYLGGLSKLNIRTRRIVTYNKQSKEHQLISNQIYGFCPDDNHGLWLIYQDMSNILTRVDLLTGEQTSQSYTHDIHDRVLHITRADDKLWLATPTSLHCYSVKERQYLFSATPQLPVQIYAMAYDSLRHSIWLSTHAHGLIRYDINSNVFCPSELETTLKDVAVRAIVPTADVLWLGTDKGIYSYDTHYGTVHRYNSYDDAEGTVFSGSLTLSDGQATVYMGGIGAWTAINTGSIVYNEQPPKVLLTDLQINNMSVYDTAFVRKELIEEVNKGKIVLRHDENNITLTLSCTNFTLTRKNRYRFRLLSFQYPAFASSANKMPTDTMWHEVDARHRTVNIMQMPHGYYRIETQACNNDGVWGDISTIDIRIKPVFWASGAAIAIYSVTAVILLFILAWAIWRHQRLRRQLYQAYIKQQEEEKASRAKVLFFTDVNRELKAPLLRLQTMVEPEFMPYVQQMLQTMDQYTEKYCIDIGNNPQLTQQQQQLDKLTQLINERMQDGRVDIDMLAIDMGMSRRKLFSFVKDFTGKAPVEYIRSYRLQTAAKLMVEHGLTIKEAMDKVGIESQSYFVKAFKLEFGDPPAAFVNKHQTAVLPK